MRLQTELPVLRLHCGRGPARGSSLGRKLGDAAIGHTAMEPPGQRLEVETHVGSWERPIENAVFTLRALNSLLTRFEAGLSGPIAALRIA